MTDDLYYRKLENMSTTDLVDMIRERDGRIAELEKENANAKMALSEAKEIIREYIRISLTSPYKRGMTEQIELFRKADKFWEEIQR